MRRANGFTLIELLVALVAGSLLLVSLGWSVTTLGRELRAPDKTAEQDRLEALAPVLTRLIEHALPPGPAGLPITAQADRLEILTSAPQALGTVGPVRMALSVKRTRNGEALFAEFAPVDPAVPLAQAARAEKMLADGYRAIDFEYALPEPVDPGVPPRLVTLVFTRRDGQVARIASAPKLNSSGDCRFDPVSLSCRP